MKVKVKKVTEDAIIPQYKTEGAVGFDFHCTESVTLNPPTIVKVPATGDDLKEMEDKYVDLIMPSMGDSELEQLKSMVGEKGVRAAILANVPEGTFVVHKIAPQPVTVGTGIAVELPQGYELEMRGRSGLAFKHDVHVFNGTIDFDYRSEIHVRLYNLGSEPITLEKGSRIAQGIVKQIEQVEFVEVDVLSETERGAKGFGSTGLK